MGPVDMVNWHNLTTLDVNPGCNPDVVWDLERLPYPFENDEFDEIHAYDVLEHCGKQGDYEFFFAQFSEFWRILKHMGLMLITTPKWDSKWAFGDPGHTRILAPGCFYYLSQDQYEKQIGKTKMADYRNIYHADFGVARVDINGDQLEVYLVAVKGRE